MVVRAVLHRHLELAFVRRKGEPASYVARLRREKFFEPCVGLCRRMEASPFNVRTKDYPHLVTNVVVAALVTRDDETRCVPALGKR